MTQTWKWTRTTLAAVLITAAATRSEAGDFDEVEALLAKLGPEIRASVDVRRVGSEGVEERSFLKNADAALPTASSIKTAIMIEMFAKFATALDAPPPGLADILKDDHPAIAHFEPKQRDEIRAGLSGATVRRVGRVMLGSEDATNLVYNAASNVAIALLGGPEETSRLIHARAPEFAPIMVRRYMLTDRKVHGDNEASGGALAAVLKRLADRSLPGLDASTIEACRTTVAVSDDPTRGRRRFKDGALDSSPITRVSTGWYERPGEPAIVYVVMLAQDDPGAAPVAETGGKLEKAAAGIALAAVDALRQPSKSEK